MPIRIYALAKELVMDSKELVELCKKAGVTGKGSALASLTDDEVVKLKAYLTGGGSKSKPAAKSAAPVRPSTIEKPRRPVLIGSQRPSKSDTAPSADEPVETADKPMAAEAAPEAPAPPAAPEAPAPKPADPPVKKPRVPGPLTRPSANAPQRPSTPAATGGKPRMIGGSQGDGKSTPKPKPKRGAPVVKLAAIPQVDQPEPTKVEKSNEPAPQKPIMTLPKDAIRTAKEGSAAPLRNFTKQQDRKRAQESMVTPATGEASPDAKGRRGRRDKDKPDQVELGPDGKPKKGLAGMASARASRGGRTGGRTRPRRTPPPAR